MPNTYLATNVGPTSFTSQFKGGGAPSVQNLPTKPPVVTPTKAVTAPATIGGYKGVPINAGNEASIQAQMKAIDAKQSTTTLSNANKMETVPKLNNQLNNLDAKGVTTDPTTGTSTTADGKVYTPPDANAGTTKEVVADTTPEDTAINQQLEEMKSSLDASTKALIDNIQEKYKIRKQEQADINMRQEKGVQNALLMGGVTGQGSSAQYAPISSSGIVQAQESYGIKKLADLDAEENDLIASAKAAQQSGNFKIMEYKLQQADKKREEKIVTATKLNEEIAKQNAKIREQNIQSSRDSAIADLVVQGITKPADILNILNGDGQGDFTAKEVSDTLKNIAETNGTDVGKMSQDVQEFYMLKNTDGGLPVSVLHLPSVADQIAAYIKMKTGAETKVKTTGVTSSGKVSTTGISEASTKSSDPFVQELLKSKGGKALTDTTIQKLDKGLSTLGQLGVLQANIQGTKTGPIQGAFRGKNPWDTNAQTIKAQLNAIVPNLARGVYGEVGVLTDNDIKTYSKTLPNLTSTQAVRDAVLYITLDMIGKSIKSTLNVNRSAGRDVSGFVDIYTEMQNTKNSILAGIPGAQVPESIKVNVGGSTPQDFLNTPLPGSGEYSPSVWEQ